jgi:hypothetical protein
VVGAPLVVVVAFILLASKDLALPIAAMALALLGLSYAALPWLLIRFYQGRNVRRTLEARDARPGWLETLPMPILVRSRRYDQKFWEELQGKKSPRSNEENLKALGY